MGLDVGGQHAVPALEARDLPRRLTRPVHRLTGRRGIKAQGEVRTQYAHIIDMVPTVLDLLGIEPPATIRGVTQSPIARRQLRPHASTTPTAPTRHHTQYFEMLGHRAIYHDGWRAVCPWPGPSFAEAGTAASARRSRAETLADARRRPAGSSTTSPRTSPRTTNVAAEHRDKLIAMIAPWYVEAGKYDVLPIDGSGAGTA